jgi:hypothetical protein
MNFKTNQNDQTFKLIEQINTQNGVDYNLEDIENYRFLNSIVAILTGHQISDFKPEKAVEITQKCMKVFENFVEKYIHEKYGKVENLRYKALKYYTGDSVLHKFKELGDQIDEAVLAFAKQAKLNILGK